MWVDPDSSLSREQILEKVWRDLSPEMQAHYTQVMVATGQTWDEICREARTRFQARYVEAEHDPESRFAREMDRQAFPFGHDPLLERSNP